MSWSWQSSSVVIEAIRSSPKMFLMAKSQVVEAENAQPLKWNTLYPFQERKKDCLCQTLGFGFDNMGWLC
jgi:hypothetical protein